MLPTSRDATFAPGDPVLSAVLNDCQDAIISSKHDVQEFGIHPARWTPSVGAPAFNGLHWSAGAAFTLYAGLHIPVGDRITRIRYYYNRQAGNVIGYLVRFTLGGGEVTVATFTDNAAVGDVFHDLAAINHTVLTTYLYAVKLQFDNTAAAAGSLGVGAIVFPDKL